MATGFEHIRRSSATISLCAPSTPPNDIQFARAFLGSCDASAALTRSVSNETFNWRIGAPTSFRKSRSMRIGAAFFFGGNGLRHFSLINVIVQNARLCWYGDGIQTFGPTSRQRLWQ